MLTEPTLDKLKQLSLFGMADAYLDQQHRPIGSELTFEERFGLLVDAEWMLRQNKRLKRRLLEAKLRLSQAAIEDVETGAARGLERAALLRLSTCATASSTGEPRVCTTSSLSPGPTGPTPRSSRV